MGRKRIPDTWCVVKDMENGQLLKVEPTSQPSYFTGTRYQVLGNFTSPEDADLFIQFKRLNTNCDSLAYLQREHALREMPDALAQIDLVQLGGQSAEVRKDTGRTCFGCCKSLSGSPACAICYSDIPKTWELCATIHIIERLRLNLEPSLSGEG